ncbi:uncharacterized protein LOC131164911 [Malania oleifera]|uniref:uncharacterized protein LOC131164911 n=1 Tax=Malania oleifera TaxID=397392 RepID=UPI0025AEA438|nr:uncharacterized protein LOC131164911 [Malania oleifera]
MNEGPKLYANKPKKAQLQQQQKKGKDYPPSPQPPASSSSAAASASSSSMGAQRPPPQSPKESFARRYKFIWPLLLTVNLAVGAYLFMRTKKKDTGIEEEAVADVPATPVSTIAEKPSSPRVTEPVKLREPIPENQQRELFKWLLEEKRKIKPKDSGEKKRIDEEKAILKQFIQAKSIPRF